MSSLLTYREFLGTQAGPSMNASFAGAVNAAIELTSPIVTILPSQLRTELEVAMAIPYITANSTNVTIFGLTDAINTARGVAERMIEVAVQLLRTDTVLKEMKLYDWRENLDDTHWRCVVDAIYAACIIEDHDTFDEFRNNAQKIADGNIGLIVRNYDGALIDDDNFRKKYIIVRRAVHDAARHYLRTLA